MEIFDQYKGKLFKIKDVIKKHEKNIFEPIPESEVIDHLDEGDYG